MRPGASDRAWAILPGRLEAVARIAPGETMAIAAAGRQKDTSPGYEVRDGIAFISMRGVMLKPVGLLEDILTELFGGVSTPQATAAVRRAAADPNVTGMVLHVDSPGGSVEGVAELAAAVRDAASRKPVVARVEDLCASAAYWAISGASSIVCSSATAEVGSIGCFMVVSDLSGMAAALGIKVYVVSSAPPLKGAGVEGSEITAPQVEEVQRRVDDLAAVMVGDVARGRGVSVTKAQTWATGAVWIAAEAQRRGLIDGVGDADAGFQGRRMQMQMQMQTDQTAYETARGLAQDLVDRGEAQTVEQGITLALRRDPNLYDQHLAEVHEGRDYRPPVTESRPPQPTTTAHTTAMARAQDLVDKGEARTVEQAVVQVYRTDPALYASHVTEQRGGAA